MVGPLGFEPKVVWRYLPQTPLFFMFSDLVVAPSLFRVEET